MRADLHIHTDVSDGLLSPEAVVEKAYARGLDLIAVTDHDAPASSIRAMERGRALGLRVLPGVELSAHHDGSAVHILAYGVAPDDPRMGEAAAAARRAKHAQVRSILDALESRGIDLSYDDVRAGRGEAEYVGRNHIARLLVERGHASSRLQAFHRFLREGASTFVRLEVESAVELIPRIVAAGGLAVLAHPTREALGRPLDEMVEAGLAGIEAYRPLQDPSRSRAVAAASRERGLVVSGGSDWHGDSSSSEVGDFHVDGEQIGELLERLGVT